MSDWGYLKDVPLLLCNKNIQKKFEGLYIVSVFELKQEKEKVMALLQDSHPLIRMKAFWTLGSIGNIQDLQTIIDFLEKENFDFSKIEHVIHVLRGLESSNEQTAYEIFHHCFEDTKNQFIQRCLVELFGKKKLQQSIPFLLNKLKHGNQEIRIGAIKSLIELDAKLALPHFINLLEWSESNNVKIIAMKGIAILGGEKYLNTMIKYLQHPIWWVRYYSAYGIARLGKKGRRELRELSYSYHDQFGREMAEFFFQIVEKEGVLWDSKNQTFMIG